MSHRRRHHGGGSARGRSGRRRGRRGKKDEEADSDEEEFLNWGKKRWTAPTRNQLKGMVQGRLFQRKDFHQGVVVGAGTFAVVRAVTLRLSDDEQAAPMALKTMKKAVLLATKQVDHVKNEKQLYEMSDCPFVVTFLASFQDERRVFLLLEYVHGGELYGRLSREGRLPVDHSKFYAAELVLAFRYLHELCVAYRDLKPENVMLDWRGHVKLTDFGFAKVVKNMQTFTVVGTPEYMAPEIIQSTGHGLPVDFWALGVLIFEMLTGLPPFFDTNPFDIYKKVLAGDVNYPRHFDVKAKHIVRNLLLRDPDSRHNQIDCMTHVWFDFVDWRKLHDQEIRAPWCPKLGDPSDARLFDPVPPEQGLDGYEDCMPISRKDNKLFVDLF